MDEATQIDSYLIEQKVFNQFISQSAKQESNIQQRIRRIIKIA
jgi:hypothetical protein